ncbi:hypothetical protein M407DRAFT_247204 [Tulasnella calospora MUT 4182]|uniref:Secreted protein n=1 Tax=Tulasnella calospora MUT 4182 TaxID=1051891 RepID=A0A0C3PZX5_9AGAM|nr:hypothetical protein M407DRAFT_247204 [Tulasnella calospora MUT 4182]
MITWWPGVTACLLHLPLSECRTLVRRRPAAGTAASSESPQAEVPSSWNPLIGVVFFDPGFVVQFSELDF